MNIDEINIIYNIDNIYDDSLEVFGSEFVENNKDNCKIIYENNEYELEECINLENNQKEKIEIKLKGINKVTDMSYMFYECNALSSLPDISKWNTSKVTNISYMFYGCNSLSSLPDISE